jgi:hypothetical protein
MVNLKELMEKAKLRPGQEAGDESVPEQADLEAANSGAPEEAATAGQDAEPPVAPADSESSSQEELLNAYRSLEERIAAMEAEAANYRRMIERTGLDAQMLRRKADDEVFMQSIRSQYETDPLSAISKLAEHSQMELWQMMEARLGRAFREHRQFKLLLQKFLEDPKNEGLKNHGRLVEHLMIDRGVRPEDVGAIIRDIEANSTQKSRLRAAAAKTVRNQAAVETGGEMGEPVDKDKDVDRVIKNAKTLDDLFAGLRRIKI